MAKGTMEAPEKEKTTQERSPAGHEKSQSQSSQSSQGSMQQTGSGSSEYSRSGQSSLQRQAREWPSLATSPFSFMRRFGEEMDRLMEDFGFGSFAPSFSRMGEGLPGRDQIWRQMWSPRVEAFERDGKFIVRAELPGLKKEDVKVEVQDDVLILQGERRHEDENKRGSYYRSEWSYGSFYRTIPLPEGANAENATASFKNGVLEISMNAPRQQQSRSRRLEIKE